MRSRGPSGRASIRAADDVLEADLQSDEIVACFEEALGERQPEMGMDAAAGREANAESAEAAPRLEAAAEQQREHSPLALCTGELNTYRYAHRRPKMPKKDVISTKPVKRQWAPRGPQEKKERKKERKKRHRTPSLRGVPR